MDDRQTLAEMTTNTSTMTELPYALIPPGRSLQGWTADEKAALNDHVRHMLHSRRSKMKRGFKGFLQYAKQREFHDR